MSAAVHYKFRSAKHFGRVQFEGDFIQLAELKVAIVEQEKLQFGEDFDLQVVDAQTQEEYYDEETLIPKNTSVIVKRVPAGQKQGILSQIALARKNERFAEILDRSTGGTGATAGAIAAAARQVLAGNLGPSTTANTGMTGSEPVRLRRGDEDTRLASVALAAGAGDSGPNPRNIQRPGGRVTAPGAMDGPPPGAQPPPGYICHRCGEPGHYIQHCTANLEGDVNIIRVKRPTGIPRSMLKTIDAPVDGGTELQLPGGKFVTLATDDREFSKEPLAVRMARLAEARAGAREDNTIASDVTTIQGSETKQPVPMDKKESETTRRQVAASDAPSESAASSPRGSTPTDSVENAQLLPADIRPDLPYFPLPGMDQKEHFFGTGEPPTAREFQEVIWGIILMNRDQHPELGHDMETGTQRDVTRDSAAALQPEPRSMESAEAPSTTSERAASAQPRPRMTASAEGESYQERRPQAHERKTPTHVQDVSKRSPTSEVQNVPERGDRDPDKSAPRSGSVANARPISSSFTSAETANHHLDAERPRPGRRSSALQVTSMEPSGAPFGEIEYSRVSTKNQRLLPPDRKATESAQATAPNYGNSLPRKQAAFARSGKMTGNTTRPGLPLAPLQTQQQQHQQHQQRQTHVQRFQAANQHGNEAASVDKQHPLDRGQHAMQRTEPARERRQPTVAAADRNAVSRGVPTSRATSSGVTATGSTAPVRTKMPPRMPHQRPDEDTLGHRHHAASDTEQKPAQLNANLSQPQPLSVSRARERSGLGKSARHSPAPVAPALHGTTRKHPRASDSSPGTETRDSRPIPVFARLGTRAEAAASTRAPASVPQRSTTGSIGSAERRTVPPAHPPPADASQLKGKNSSPMNQQGEYLHRASVRAPPKVPEKRPAATAAVGDDKRSRNTPSSAERAAANVFERLGPAIPVPPRLAGRISSGKVSDGERGANASTGASGVVANDASKTKTNLRAVHAKQSVPMTQQKTPVPTYSSNETGSSRARNRAANLPW
jgi:hypothetical protein